MHIIGKKSSGNQDSQSDFAALKKNMEEGDWLMDYTLERLSSYQHAQPDMNLHGLIGFIS